MWLQPINSQLLIGFLNSIKYWSRFSELISDISNVEKPGVSAIYVLSSNLYNFIAVVVFFPLLFLLLISPSSAVLLLNIAFINVDFPTPEFPEKALVSPFNTFFTSSIPTFSFATVSITLYPIFLYNSVISEYLLSKSILLNIITLFTPKNSANASCLSNSSKSGFGFFNETTNIIWVIFAILGSRLKFYKKFC